MRAAAPLATEGADAIDAPLAPASSAVAMGLIAAVNDAPFVLSGAGSFVDDAEWPSFEAIELCGAPRTGRHLHRDSVQETRPASS